MGISYITREDLTSALGDNSPAARGAALLDRAIESGSRAVDQLCHRVFYPTTGSRILDRASSGDHLWFDADEMLSITSLTVDGSVEPPSTYRLDPNSGPPYTSLKFGSTRSFTRSSVITTTGVFGACDDQVAAGALAAAIVSTTATTLTVTNGALVGVGDLLTIDTERVQVTGRSWVSGSDTGTLAGSNAAQTLAVASGSAWNTGETLLIDAEQVLVTDIAGNNLVVKRAVNGTSLAAHTSAALYVNRGLSVVRAATGTTAATHLISAAITRLQAPALVRALALAEAEDRILQEAAGYARTVGTGDNARPASGGGLDPLRAQTYAAHGRKGRQR